MTVTYTVGDTRKVIKGIPDGSVDLIATSPPFLALRSYVPEGHESKGDEIGSERNPAEFIDMLLGLTAEWGRVLATHGSIAIELGDTYSGSGGAGGDYDPETGLRAGQPAYKGSNARREHRVTLPDGRTIQSAGIGNGQARNGSSWPRAKSLALIPQLYAVALAYGINPLTGAPSPAGRWLVRNVIVWHRPNPAVGALGDKVRPSTSYIVIATRSPKRWFDLSAVRSGVQTKPGGTTGRGNTPDESRGPYQNTGSHEAGAPPLDAWFDPYDSDLAEAMSYDGSQENAAADAASHDTWTLTTQPSRLAHYAMWPAKLAERLILMMCPREVCRICGEPRRRMEGAAEYVQTRDRSTPTVLDMREGARAAAGVRNWSANGAAKGDNSVTRTAPTLGWTDCGHNDHRPGVVLDPFAGSGTTLAVADLHGRDAIGIDFNPANHDLYPARYDEVKRALYGTPAPMPGQETFDFAI